MTLKPPPIYDEWLHWWEHYGWAKFKIKALGLPGASDIPDFWQS